MITYTFPIIIGGEEEVLNERSLLTEVEEGMMMSGTDAVRFIVIHCSATRVNRNYTVEQMMRDHKARGFRTIGYHFYIRKSGEVTQHRRLLEVGAHAQGYNRCSIGVCYEGGLDDEGRPADTLTRAQYDAMWNLLRKLKITFPQAKIVGHRDLPGTTPKACPCFDAAKKFPL